MSLAPSPRPSRLPAIGRRLIIGSMGQLTRILSAIEEGDPQAASRLLPLIYDELRRLASRLMALEKPGQTLQPTALVHEVFLRLTGQDEARQWQGLNHFYAAAAEAMRRILVENARRKRGPRRGGHLRRVDVDPDRVALDVAGVDVLALDEALRRLAEESPARAELVKLRFFAGLTVPEAAEVLGVSVATAERHWTFARTRLYADLNPPDPASENLSDP
jgi:RNA polymerase sigma factor (TIGR02999 family)